MEKLQVLSQTALNVMFIFLMLIDYLGFRRKVKKYLRGPFIHKNVHKEMHVFIIVGQEKECWTAELSR